MEKEAKDVHEGQKESRPLVLFNGNVITLEPKFPHTTEVCLRGNRILSVGEKLFSRKERSGRGEFIDCRGKTVLPGFIDAHLHFLSLAESLVSLNLGPRNGVHSIADIQSSIRKLARSLEPGTWIRGKGYNEFTLEDKRHPNRWDLDKAAPAHPVKLTHRSGHAHVLNSCALQLIGIRTETPEPPGGLMDRALESGEPTGLLFEMGDFLSQRIPPLDSSQMERGISLAGEQMLSLGITSVQDASSRNDVERWGMFRTRIEAGLLLPRMGMIMGVKAFDRPGSGSFPISENPQRLHVSGIKIILDETTGQLHPSQPQLNHMVLSIHQAGFQAVIHAVEENAIESACNAVKFALERIPRRDHRHRIEHCSVCPPSLSKRIASLGIQVVTQPAFLYYSGDRYLKTVPPEQFPYLYPIKTLMRSGARVAGSSDSPVIPANPLVGIYSAVARMSDTGRPLLDEEGITAMEALRMFTEYAATAAFEESEKGTIAPGKLADLVVLSGDPTTVSPDEVKDLEVEMTILDGNVVWDRMN